MRDGHPRPEVDHLNFTPRVRTPMLMLNGRYDLALPYQSSAKPMFDLLGIPEKHWLDTYLGPVEVAAR